MSADLTMPRWAYVPGQNDGADHATLAKALALVPPRFEGFVPAQHPALRYGLALNELGFFWECHEILEAVWAAAPQGGRDRILLRACIQIANAQLKLKMKRPRAAARLFAEARAELDELAIRRSGAGEGFADVFPAGALAARLQAVGTGSADAAPILLGIASER